MDKPQVTVEGKIPRSFGFNRRKLTAAATYFAMRSSTRIGCPFRSVTVILQDDVFSDEVHRGIMNIEGATDVITQRYDPMPGEPDGIYGEIYVNCSQALRVVPKRRGWSHDKELLLYIAHGMDHLTGADDLTPEEYARMRRRELGWISDWLMISPSQPLSN
jgi:rRNA maturation RNase YbeY